MHHHRADDLPAYLVVVIVGHVVVGAFMGVEATSTLSTWQHLAIWVPLTIVLAALACCGPSRAPSSGCNGRSTCTASAAKRISSRRIRKPETASGQYKPFIPLESPMRGTVMEGMTKAQVDKAEAKDFALGGKPMRPRDAATLILLDRQGRRFSWC